MLHIFRESIGRFVAIGILSLIAVTFVFFGIDFSITQLSFAARVNGETISVNDFDRRLRQEHLQRRSPHQPHLHLLVGLAEFLDEWDAQRALLGPDPWEYGLTPANRKNLENLIGYSRDGGLISNLESVDEFFTDVMLEARGRGESAAGYRH